MEPFYDRIMNYIRIEMPKEEKENDSFQKGVLLFLFGIGLIVSLILNDMEQQQQQQQRKQQQQQQQ